MLILDLIIYIKKNVLFKILYETYKINGRGFIQLKIPFGQISIEMLIIYTQQLFKQNYIQYT
jgi:hypothetical protein